jgi:anti-sigma B factor antagonist
MLEQIAMPLEILIRESDGVTIVDLSGRASIGPNTDRLNHELRRLAAEGVRKILVNLAGLTMIDSSGIATIAGSYVSLVREGGILKLLRPSDRVREVLTVMRILNSIPTFEDEAEALASFRAATTRSANS